MTQKLVQAKQFVDLNASKTTTGTFDPARIPFNFVNNGSMSIWQRGTSFPGMTSTPISVPGQTLADRFRFSVGNFAAPPTAVATGTRESDVPASSGSEFSLKVENTTPEAVVAADDSSTVSHVIEGYNYRSLYGNVVTLSFWVKSNLTGTYCLAMYNLGPFAPDRSYVSEYIINVANTWERKEITVDINYTGGINNFTTGKGLSLVWTLMAGTSFQGTPDFWDSAGSGTWPTGWPLATSNQVNLHGTIGNYFQLADVQLELGASVSPFVYLPYQDDLAWCQRYFEKSYNLTTVPGTAQALVKGLGEITVRDAVCNPTIHQGPQFKVRKRVGPTMILYSPVTGTASTLYYQHGRATKGAPGDVAINDVTTVNETGVGAINLAANIGTPDGTITAELNDAWSNIFSLHYTADADL